MGSEPKVSAFGEVLVLAVRQDCGLNEFKGAVAVVVLLLDLLGGKDTLELEELTVQGVFKVELVGLIDPDRPNQTRMSFLWAPRHELEDIYSSESSGSSLPDSPDELSESSSDGRSGSPAPSLYSFSSSVDGQLMLRQVYGRILNNQNDTYFLPADTEEHRRLDLQHQVITLALGGLYPAPDLVRRALRPRPGKPPQF
ncbi:hypothetical protein C2E23DRAFT_881639 [Lenzites betulinus]|nr:hypothetical protein C2E23DRAFT_881639 [Lenzites betulinus]